MRISFSFRRAEGAFINCSRRTSETITGRGLALQVSPDNLARVHARLQTVESLIQPHLSASHENQFRQNAFGSKEVCRFEKKILKKLRITKVKSLFAFHTWRVKLTIKASTIP